MDIISRLKLYMEKYRIGSSQFADYAGISRPTLSQILNGRNKKISDELISKIHNAYPRLSVLWLLFGEGNMELDANNEISEPQNSLKQDNLSLQNQVNERFTDTTDFFGVITEKVSEKSETSSISFPDEKTPSNNSATDEKLLDLEIGDKNSILSAKSSKMNVADTAGDQATLDQKKLAEFIPRSGKRIKNIVVFYDDATFETFLPS